MNAVPPTVDYRAIAIDTIRQEHRALGQVLELLQHLLRDIAARHTEPDFRLFALAFYYIDDFVCRVHHPKEDQYIFAAVRRHTQDFDETLEQLQKEHLRDDETMPELYRLLVLYQAGAPGAFELLRAALDLHATMLYKHMRKEEMLLTDERLPIPAEEWRAMAEAFSANEDPLFGEKSRREFSILHRRILNLLPSKMRPAAHAAERAGE